MLNEVKNLTKGLLQEEPTFLHSSELAESLHVI